MAHQQNGFSEKSISLCVLATAIIMSLTSSASAFWQSVGKLSVPEYNYNFLATTPEGHLLASTFYSAAASSPPPDWKQSYEAIIQEARQQERPMLVYFRREGTSEDFENNVILTDPFNERANAGKFVCVFEDVSRSRLLSYNFGVYRVPHVAVLDKFGNTVAEFTYSINADELFAAMESVYQ